MSGKKKKAKESAEPPPTGETLSELTCYLGRVVDELEVAIHNWEERSVPLCNLEMFDEEVKSHIGQLRSTADLLDRHVDQVIRAYTTAAQAMTIAHMLTVHAHAESDDEVDSDGK